MFKSRRSLVLAASLLLGVFVLAASAPGAGKQLAYGAPVAVGQVPGVGGYVSQIAAADFNGDGRTDLIFTRSVYLGTQTFPVAVLLNDGHGRFVDGTSSVFSGPTPLTQNARELVVADFNGDHRPDVFVADHGDDESPFPGFQDTLILSAPGGKLVDATANLPQASDFTHSAAAADVNGDGAVDLYAGNVYGGNLVPPRILLNDGTGHFSIGDGLLPAAVTDVTADRYMASLFVDVNEDGKVDLVLGADQNAARSQVLLNDGTGHFSTLADAMPTKPFAPEGASEDIASADFNGDGHPDLLLAATKNDASFTGRWVQVLINNGDGAFRDATSTYLPQVPNDSPWPTFLEIRDLNRDGRPDFGLRVGGGAGGAPLLYLLSPSRVFQPGPFVPVGNNLWTFVDGAGSGANDIAAVDPTSGAVRLFPEIRPPGTPTGLLATRTLRTGIQLQWGAAARATRYEVWRGRSQIATTTRLSYLDWRAAAGSTFRYRVRARDVAGAGPWSRTVAGRRRG